MSETFESRYQRWASKNPGKSVEDFKKALIDFHKGKKAVTLPKGRYLPGGIFVSCDNINSSDIATMAREFTGQSFGQQ